jgi:four helix bundle protein
VVIIKNITKHNTGFRKFRGLGQWLSIIINNTMKVYSFEKLECWQLARQLAVWTYNVTKNFPTEEKFGIISQMRRAAISIASNIAEGTSRKTAKDQSHFSTIAYSSTIELLNDLIIANDLGFLTNENYAQGRVLIEKQTLIIATLRKSQQRINFLSLLNFLNL